MLLVVTAVRVGRVEKQLEQLQPPCPEPSPGASPEMSTSHTSRLIHSTPLRANLLVGTHFTGEEMEAPGLYLSRASALTLGGHCENIYFTYVLFYLRASKF